MRILLAASACMLVAIALGCTSPEPTSPTAVPPCGCTTAAAPAPAPAGPQPSDPQKKWIHGRVYQVWPYENGALMAYLGTKDGIKNGDLLVLQRNRVTINTVTVVDAHEDLFYGRAVGRDENAYMPQEGDMVVIVPGTNLPPPPEPKGTPKK